ncbi:MAG: hypothetical protein ACFFDI_30785 [Promethearchaeota archaeon]
MHINEIKDIDGVKQFLKIVWGAITSFQQQLYSIQGDIESIKISIDNVEIDFGNIHEFLNEMQKVIKGEENVLIDLINEYDTHLKEVNQS